jgi:hypothetical protein
MRGSPQEHREEAKGKPREGAERGREGWGVKRGGTWSRRATKEAPEEVRRQAMTLQYRRGTKARISASRSATNRSATDCTRPATAAVPTITRHLLGSGLPAPARPAQLYHQKQIVPALEPQMYYQ